MSTLTNTIASPALQRQCVKITLDLTNEETYIAFNTLQIGQEVLSSNNIVGYVDSIDTYGNSFKVKPTIDESNQNFYFYDTKKGIFNQGDSFEIL